MTAVPKALSPDTPPLRITAIGTCRIAHPLARGQKEDRYFLENGRVYGFVHCTKDIIQQIRFIQGELDIPEHLQPFIFNEGRRASSSLPPPTTDLYLVEVSSLKEVFFDGYYLQYNHLTSHFADRPEVLRAFLRNGPPTKQADRAKELEAIPSFRDCSALEREILLNATVAIQDFDGLVADLRRIFTMLRQPVVIVSHCDVTVAGKTINGRRRLIEYLRKAAPLLRFELFEPTPLIGRLGQEFAMANGGADSTHYSSEFEAILGDELYDRYIAPRRLAA